VYLSKSDESLSLKLEPDISSFNPIVYTQYTSARMFSTGIYVPMNSTGCTSSRLRHVICMLPA